MSAALLAIDAGTTGVRTYVIDERGRPLTSAYREFTQHFPQPGRVEHDAEEIWAAVSATIAEALANQNLQVDRKLIKLDDPLKAIGSYEVPIRFSGDTSVEIRVNVVGV
mgnify:CR=1 FL=1